MSASAVHPLKYVEVNDIHVCYVEKGEGAVPIIFIHGFPFNKSAWYPQLQFLSANHRVIAYDIRGFGGSTLGNTEPSLDLYANDLLGFMDAIGVKKAIVCGLSMGGYIVMNALAKSAGRFEAVILSSTQCIADSIGVKQKRYDTIRQIESEGLARFAEDFVNSVFSNNTKENNKKLVEEMRSLILSASPASIIGSLRALAKRRETCTDLKRANLPALILCGTEDQVIPRSQAEFIFNNIKDAKFFAIEKAGHLPNLEQPDMFNDHIHNFIPGVIS